MTESRDKKAKAGLDEPKNLPEGAAAPRDTSAAGFNDEARAHDAADAEGRATQVEQAKIDRLLAPVRLSVPVFDRNLLPADFVNALDGAKLATPELLPSAAFMCLAAINAIAGPDVALAPDPFSAHSGLSLRVCLLAADRSVPFVPDALYAGAYAAENDALMNHQASVEQVMAERHVAEERRRLHRQATRALLALGRPALPSFVEDMPACPARPRIVVTGASAAIRAAAAGGTGVLFVTERCMPSLANVGDNYDMMTDGILTRLVLDHTIEVENPETGRIEMIALPACAIGVLTRPEWPTLAKAVRAQLRATVFLPAAPPPIGGDSLALSGLMRRVYDLGLNRILLQLSPQNKVLEAAAAAWTTMAAHARPPLSDHLAILPDLVKRLAASLHLAEAASGSGNVTAEIPEATVERAVAIVNAYLLPVAQALLSPLSQGETERDARRIIAYARENASTLSPELERRTLLRAWQRSMPGRRLDAALALLEECDLIDIQEGSGGLRFAVAPSVFAAS